MNAFRNLNYIWSKVFEGCVVLGTLAVFAIAGVCVGWYRDDGPVFVVNPDPAVSYVETARIHPGDEVVVHRSMRRTDDCGAHSSAWLVMSSGGKTTLFPLQNYLSFAMPLDHFGTSRLGFMTPLRQAPGKYSLRTVVECQRNPLSTVAQNLPDLPFEIVAPGEPLTPPSP